MTNTTTDAQREFAIALHEMVSIRMDEGMPTTDMVPIMEKELARLRQPYQNPEDNEAEAKAQR